MDEITHYIDIEGNLVINANGDGYSYGAVLKPNIIGGYPHIKKRDINTDGLDFSEKIRSKIISAITTQRGKNKEVSVILDNE